MMSVTRVEKRVEVVDPLTSVGWTDSLISEPAASFFQTSNWAAVLRNTYGYKPLFLVIKDDIKIRAVVPFMEIETILSPRRGVSLPFTDYCDPIFYEGEKLQGILDCLVGYGTRAKWRYLELRTVCPLPDGVEASAIFYGHLLDISGKEQDILAGFRDSNRRNIRKAEKEGIEVIIDGSEEAIREFYRLNCLTRRDHGLPCQPFLFFKNVFSHVINKKMGYVALAAIDGRIVAGAVFFHFGDRAIYKYGASDKQYQHLRCNNLIMWKAIQWYKNHGFRFFDFGRTEPENTGLLQFKRGWGAVEFPINYCRYDFRRNAFVAEKSKVSGWHNKIFSRMPIQLLKIFGSLLYRHAG
jgi:lipid II:glycine glycyltransferase (peptidoglycan interpeptide bridge formation enzyme)